MIRTLFPALLGAMALLVYPAAAAGFPPGATRAEPPHGIAARALAVGARAPAFALPSTQGSDWSLTSALRSGPAVLVFYRGDW